MAEKILMVDTPLLTDYFRKTDTPKSRLVLLSEQFEKLAISSVTEFEAYSGASSSQLNFWNELLDEFKVYPFDSKAAHMAVEIQQSLKQVRRTIEKADLFIATTAVANNLPLDTLNRKHFGNISRLLLLYS